MKFKLSLPKAFKLGHVKTRKVIILATGTHLGVPFIIQMYHDLVQVMFAYKDKWYQNHIQLNTQGDNYMDVAEYPEEGIKNAASMLMRNVKGSIEDLVLPASAVNKSKKGPKNGKEKKT